MKNSLLLLLLYACWANLYSQQDISPVTESPSIINYTVKDGLAQMQVHCIFQDSKGIIWVGTRQGLSRFNGKTFTTFRTKEGLPHQTISDIDEDSKGHIWISTRGGIAVYDGNKISTLPVKTGYKSTIQIDRHDRVWCSNNYTGELYVIDEDLIVKNISKKYKALNIEQRINITLDPTHNQLYISLAHEGIKYAIDNDSLRSQILTSKWRFIPGDKKQLYIAGFPSKKESNIPIAQFQNGVPKLFGSVPKYKLNQFYVKNSFLYQVSQNRDLKSSLLTVTNLVDSTSVQYDNLEIYLPSCITVDENNHIWIGSDRGIVKIILEPFTNYESSSFNNAWNVLEDNNGDLWISSYTNGLQVVKNERIQAFLPDVTANIPFYTGPLLASNGDKIFPNQQGILRVNTSNEISWLDSCVVNCLSQMVVEDVNNKVIISGVRNGIRIIDSKTQQVEFIGQDQLHENDYVVAIVIDKNNDWWLGSSKGLTKYSFKEKKAIKHYTKEKGNLPALGVISATMSHDSTLWFGMTSGLYKYNYIEDDFEQIAPQTVNTQINSMVTIDEHFLLVGSVKGLDVIDIRKINDKDGPSVYHLDEASGFTGLEPFKNGMSVDRQGNAWIPCQDKLVKLNINQFVSKLEISKSTLLANINNHKDRNEIGTYRLPYNENRAEIVCEITGATLGGLPVFSSKLNSGKWTSWSTQNPLIINNLIHGTNTIIIRAKNNFYSSLVKNKAILKLETNFSFRKKHSHIIIIISIVIITFFVLLVMHWLWNRRTLKKENKRISSLLTNYRLQSLEGKMNPHFINDSIDLIRHLIYNEDKSIVTEYMKTFSRMITQFNRNFLRTAFKDKHINEVDKILFEEEFRFIQDYCHLQKEILANSSIKIINDINQDQQYKLVPMVIQPFVENAIQYAFTSFATSNEIIIKFYIENNLCCQIIDNGKGITNKPIDCHFLEFATTSKNSMILKERIKLLLELDYYLDIHLKSTPNQGTTVTIKFN